MSDESSIQYVLTDIDDTMTDHGQLGPEAYAALWDLSRAGFKVIPVTGRPAGWCEMIARFWPVAGVVGENGGFYFRYEGKKMHRHFLTPDAQRLEHRRKLDQEIAPEILKSVPGSAIASDQFCRLMDLAIDFREDVPALSDPKIKQIVQIFEEHGAQAKISSIHVNGWFGNYDKLSTSLLFLKKEFDLNEKEVQTQVAFVGDSPNDEPMFSHLKHSFAVANVKSFLPQMAHKPRHIASLPGGLGFQEIASELIASRKK